MPHQNRVTPFGEIIATPARGTLMGNRGHLHNDRQQIVRSHQLERWIICVLQFKDRRREIMRPGQYTELFFLDEATALAAGHRPCAECSRARFEAFRCHWALANPELAPGPKPPAPVIDAVLHRERMDANRQKVTFTERLGALPDGSFVTLDGEKQAHLVVQGFLFAWIPEGYQQRIVLRPDLVAKVLTPRSIVRALIHGYRAEIHPTARS